MTQATMVNVMTPEEYEEFYMKAIYDYDYWKAVKELTARNENVKPVNIIENQRDALLYFSRYRPEDVHREIFSTLQAHGDGLRDIEPLQLMYFHISISIAQKWFKDFKPRTDVNPVRYFVNMLTNDEYDIQPMSIVRIVVGLFAEAIQEQKMLDISEDDMVIINDAQDSPIEWISASLQWEEKEKTENRQLGRLEDYLPYVHRIEK